MKYLLDTNVLIRLIRPKHAAAILKRLEVIAEDDVAVCSVVRAELVAGALRSERPAFNLDLAVDLLADFDSLPLDDHAADYAGRLGATLSAAGKPIGPNDLLIAAIALANGLTLVTHNTSEFGRVPGLAIEDWEVETSP